MSTKRKLFQDAKQEITGQFPAVALHHDNDEIAYDEEKPDITQDKDNVFATHNINKASRNKPIDTHYLNEATQRALAQDPNSPDNDKNGNSKQGQAGNSLSNVILRQVLSNNQEQVRIEAEQKASAHTSVNPIGFGNTFLNPKNDYKNLVASFDNFNKYGFSGLMKGSLKDNHFNTASKLGYVADDGVKCLPTSANYDVFNTRPKKDDTFNFKSPPTLSERIATNAKLDAEPPSRALTNRRLNDRIDISVQTVGNTSFTMTNPITGKVGTVPYLIERVSKEGKVGNAGDQYFVGRDGRHFKVKDGQPEYIKGEDPSDLSKRRLQETNKVIAEWNKTGHPSTAAMVRKLDDIADSSATVLPPVEKPHPMKDMAKKAFENSGATDLAKKGTDFIKHVAPSIGFAPN